MSFFNRIVQRFVDRVESVQADSDETVDGGRAEENVESNPDLTGGWSPAPASSLYLQYTWQHNKYTHTEIRTSQGDKELVGSNRTSFILG